MALKSTGTLMTSIRQLLGVSAAATQFYTDALLAEQMTLAISQLQNVMDEVDSAGFMTGVVSGALSTSETISEATLVSLINLTEVNGIRDIRRIAPLSGSGLTHLLQKETLQGFVNASLNPRIWSNMHFWAWDSHARVLRVKPGLPLGSPDTYTILYSYYHVAISDGNLSQNVVMPEAMYPIFTMLTALRVTLSQTGDGNAQRAQTLLEMLNTEFAAKFGRAFLKHAGGDRDNLATAIVGGGRAS